MRIEDDKIIIESVEQAECIAKLMSEPPKLNDKMKEALASYRELHEGTPLDLFDLSI